METPYFIRGNGEEGLKLTPPLTIKEKKHLEYLKYKQNGKWKEYSKTWRNKEGFKIAHKKYYQTEIGKQKKSEMDKRYHAKADKVAIKDKFLKQTYGISIEQFNQMLVSQYGKCAICGRDFTNSKDTHVDHEHGTTKIRQLLCSRCNLLIGLAKENIETLNGAINYLIKWK